LNQVDGASKSVGASFEDMRASMTEAIAGSASRYTETLRRILESVAFQRLITALIIVNAITLGFETSDAAMARAGTALVIADRLIVAVFVLEILAKIAVYQRRFLRDPWNVFDLAVISLSILPATSAFSVFRAFRVLRVLRLISAVPSMRQVVQGLLNAIPGMATTAGLLLLAFYVFSVIATKLFGDRFVDWFGTLGASMYTLFQIMTLESWSMGIVRPVMEAYPWAWAFFVPFIIVTAFAVLNLFVAIIVNAMSAEAVAETSASAHADNERILEEIVALRRQVADLSSALEGKRLDSGLSRGASP
jgi:voltage-gated sodium channel